MKLGILFILFASLASSKLYAADWGSCIAAAKVALIAGKYSGGAVQCLCDISGASSVSVGVEFPGTGVTVSFNYDCKTGKCIGGKVGNKDFHNYESFNAYMLKNYKKLVPNGSFRVKKQDQSTDSNNPISTQDR